MSNVPDAWRLDRASVPYARHHASFDAPIAADRSRRANRRLSRVTQSAISGAPRIEELVAAVGRNLYR
jgi:hypothetical protein